MVKKINNKRLKSLKNTKYKDISISNDGIRIRECAKELDKVFHKWMGRKTINREDFFNIMHWVFIIWDKEYFDEINYYQDCINKLEHTLRFRALQKAAEKTKIDIDGWSKFGGNVV